MTITTVSVELTEEVRRMLLLTALEARGFTAGTCGLCQPAQSAHR